MQEWITELQTICPLRDPASMPFVVAAPFKCVFSFSCLPLLVFLSCIFVFATQLFFVDVAGRAPAVEESGSKTHEVHPDSKGTPPTPLPPLDSFNVLLQRYFRDMQDSRTFHNDMLRRLVRKFTNMERPGWLGQIHTQVRLSISCVCMCVADFGAGVGRRRKLPRVQESHHHAISGPQ